MKDILQWSPLQTRVTMSIANAKLFEFQAQAYRAGELITLGVLARAEAADILQEAADYNALTFEYGADKIQAIMAAAFSEAAAA